MRFLSCYLRLRGFGRDNAQGWGAAILAARSRHAKDLARQRDRRLSRNSKYFTSIRLGERRRATVVLALERRHLFPEEDVPDRTVEDWKRELDEIGDGKSKTLGVEVFKAKSNAEGLSWRLFGSPAQRAFLDAHRRRHRDEPGELVLGFVEQRCPVGLVAKAWILRPKKLDRNRER